MCNARHWTVVLLLKYQNSLTVLHFINLKACFRELGRPVCKCQLQIEAGFERSSELILWYSSLMYHLSLTFDPCQQGPNYSHGNLDYNAEKSRIEGVFDSCFKIAWNLSSVTFCIWKHKAVGLYSIIIFLFHFQDLSNWNCNISSLQALALSPRSETGDGRVSAH